jgi:hypothetical protein
VQEPAQLVRFFEYVLLFIVFLIHVYARQIFRTTTKILLFPSKDWGILSRESLSRCNVSKQLCSSSANLSKTWYLSVHFIFSCDSTLKTTPSKDNRIRRPFPEPSSLSPRLFPCLQIGPQASRSKATRFRRSIRLFVQPLIRTRPSSKRYHWRRKCWCWHRAVLERQGGRIARRS